MKLQRQGSDACAEPIEGGLSWKSLRGSNRNGRAARKMTPPNFLWIVTGARPVISHACLLHISLKKKQVVKCCQYHISLGHFGVAIGKVHLIPGNYRQEALQPHYLGGPRVAERKGDEG